MLMNKRRVVITGLGCITALGKTSDEMFEGLCSGQSGISNIESFDTTEYPVKFGGEVKTFRIKDYATVREGKRMDRFSQMAVASAVRAVEDSGLDFKKEDTCRSGVLIGTGIGGRHRGRRFGRIRLAPGGWRGGVRPAGDGRGVYRGTCR